MTANVIMPQMGESIFEGTITKWLKKVGDPVKRDPADIHLVVPVVRREHFR